MKESKFIELLNLYIDQQISPEDAALLEAEILQNPRRRQIYSQYCRIHRACTIALEQQKVLDETAPAQGRGRVFEAPRRSRWGYYAAGLAAAACVSLVAVLEVVRPGGGISAGARSGRATNARAARSVPTPMVAPVRSNVALVRFLPRTDGYVARHLRFLAISGRTVFRDTRPESLVLFADVSDTRIARDASARAWRILSLPTIRQLRKPEDIPIPVSRATNRAGLTLQFRSSSASPGLS